MLFSVAAMLFAAAAAMLFAAKAAKAAKAAEWYAFYDECFLKRKGRNSFIFLVGFSFNTKTIENKIVLTVPSEETFSDRMSSWMEDVPRFGDIIVINFQWKDILKDVGFSPNPDTLMRAMKSYIKVWMTPLSEHNPLYRPRVIFCVLPPTLEELPIPLGMIFANALSALDSEMKGGIEGFFHSGGENFDSDLQEFIENLCRKNFLQSLSENRGRENFDSVLYRFIGNPEEEYGQSG